MKISELNEASSLGTGVGNWLQRNVVGNLPGGHETGLKAYTDNKQGIQQRQMEQGFLRNFEIVYNGAVESGAVDIAAPLAGGAKSVTQTGNSVAGGSPAAQQSPEDIRKAKLDLAAKAAQNQMSPKPATGGSQSSTQSGAPTAGGQSPEDIRKAKGAIAAQAAQSQMKPKPSSAPSAEDIRKAKQSQAQRTLNLDEGIFSDFSKMNTLIENLVSNKLLMEGMSPGDYARAYIKKLTHSFNMSPYKSTVQNLVKEFDDEAKKNKKFPSKAAAKIYNFYLAARSTQPQDQYGNVVGGSGKPSKQPGNQSAKQPAKQPGNQSANLTSALGAVQSDPESLENIKDALVQLGLLLTRHHKSDVAGLLGQSDLFNLVIQAQPSQNKP